MSNYLCQINIFFSKYLPNLRVNHTFLPCFRATHKYIWWLVIIIHETDQKTVQEVLGRTNCLLSLIRHGPHWKQRLLQFFYCCLCIRYRGNVSTEPLPSNDKGILNEPLPSNYRGDTQTQAHTQTATRSHKLTPFFQNNENRLKNLW
jgi:hypothetical protein